MLVTHIAAATPQPPAAHGGNGDVWSAALLLAAALGLCRVVKQFIVSGANVNVSMVNVYKRVLSTDKVSGAHV